MNKTALWNKTRAQLKIEFEKNGITRCEVCGSGMYLGFAHRYKRRFITTIEELKICALLCVTCHENIEYSGHENMKQAVDKIIAERGADTRSNAFGKRREAI